MGKILVMQNVFWVVLKLRELVLQVCYLSIVKEQCFTGCPDVRECAYLLQHLDYADMLMIMMTKVNYIDSKALGLVVQN